MTPHSRTKTSPVSSASWSSKLLRSKLPKRSLKTSGRLVVASPRIARGKREMRKQPITISDSAPSVKMIRRLLGISQDELARITGYSTRSIAAWEIGKSLSDAAKQKLAEIDRLRGALAQLMPPAKLGEWLGAPTPAFEGQTPIQVLERGESDRLWRMIFQIDANVAT